MARRKKRGSLRPEEARKEAGGAEHSSPLAESTARKRLPPASPPRKKLPLLIGCIALFAIWLVLLGWLAVQGASAT